MANETPRTKEKEVRTAEIEQAARKIFLSRGFQAATIQEIAEEARIAKGTVYLYYKSKEDLYTALLLPSLEFLNVKFNALLSEVEGEKFATGEELFEALADVFVELQQRDPEIAMIYEGFQIGTFASSVSKETLDRLNGFGRRNFQVFRAIFEKGCKDLCYNHALYEFQHCRLDPVVAGAAIVISDPPALLDLGYYIYLHALSSHADLECTPTGNLQGGLVYSDSIILDLNRRVNDYF